MSAPIVVASRIDSVRLHRSGAVVRRVATVPPFEAESVLVRLADLTLVLDDGSLRLEATGGASVFDVAVTLEAATATSADGTTLSRELQSATKVEARVKARVESLEGAARRLEDAAMVGRPDGAEGEPPRELDVQGRLSLLAFKRREDERIAKELLAAHRDLARASAERARLVEAVAKARATALPKPDELRKSVVATLRRGAATDPVTIAAEYYVPGARWAPAYSLRIDRKKKTAAVELRAVVSQATGEDWSDVAVRFSTADVMRSHELPELPSLKIGRAQPPPRKRTYRPLETNPAELFADYARAATLPATVTIEPAPHEAPPDTFDTLANLVGADAPDQQEGGSKRKAPPPPPQAKAEAASAGSALAEEAGNTAVLPPASAAPRGMGMPLARKSAGLFKARLSSTSADIPKPARAPAPAAPAALELDDRVLSYSDLRMPPAEEQKGKLRLATLEERYLEMSHTIVVVEHTHLVAEVRNILDSRLEQASRAAYRALPARHVAPGAVDGFDYVHEGAVRVDVPADGDFHSLPVASFEAPLVLRHVVVPRESADAFRFVELENPLDAPLLEGPCDVYFDREFLMTIDLATVAPRGRLSAGLGVDQSIKVARNTTFAESTSGLMGGSLSLKHTIKIEITSHRTETSDVEVRERVPIVPEREEDLKVEILGVQPPWRAWEPPPPEAPLKGAYAWRVQIEPRARAELTATYVVKLPSKMELVGGNRRD